MVSNDVIVGSEYYYVIDNSHGLSSDGYIATGTESIVYKGMKISRDHKTMLSCVLKFKYKSIEVGAEEGKTRIIDVYQRFISHDLKIFDELQNCRSVVRIFDVIGDLGDFSVTDKHVPAGEDSISINRERFFCVVEEYIDGWSLEEYCRDEYWKLTETVDVGNNLKKRVPFHQFSTEKQKIMLRSYQHDYDVVIRYQSEMLKFMSNLCEIMKYITDEKKILHLDIKPDNIMITKHGREIVLIDFGRSDYIDSKTNFVQSPLGAADYNQEKQSFARQFQYGTLGYAAPECFAVPIRGSKFPFDNSAFEQGKMSVESDIFSIGATFWECLCIFELYTGNQLFSSEKSNDGYGVFYREYLLNDEAYCDRDLSISNLHFHEKLENIIKVRNSFGVSGVMAGMIGTVLLVCGFLKLTGSYFAQQKIDTIMRNYNPTSIERLEDYSIEQMRSSTESEKHNIYNKVYKFLAEQEDNLDYSEAALLIDLLKYINEDSFINDSVDTLLLTVDQKGFSSCVEYMVTGLYECDSTGYELAVQIYNAQKRVNLSECYHVLTENVDNVEFSKLVQRLAQDLDHDELITKIAEEQLPQDIKQADKNSREYINKIAELKNEIRITLDSVITGDANEDI